VRVALVLAAAAACGIPDVKVYNPLACGSASGPIPQDIVVSGKISDPFQRMNGFEGGISHITVTPVPSGPTTMTDGSGSFSIELHGSGAPIAVHFELSGSGFFPSAFFPAAALTSDYYMTAEVFLDTELAAAGSAGITVGSDTEQMIISAVDCTDAPFPGVAVEVSPGTVIGLDGGMIDPTSDVTTEPYAAVVVVDFTGSTVLINATYGSEPFSSSTVMPSLGVLVETELGPSSLDL
jgi:hypothetical protein